MKLEGGFQGRTNKLVDGCYSFWGAGDFPIIKSALSRHEHVNTSNHPTLYRSVPSLLRQLDR